MPRSPTETVKAYYSSFRASDWEAQIPGLFSHDATYLNFASEAMSPETKAAIPWAGTWRGHHEIIAFQRMLNANFEVREFDDHTFIENGENVVVFGVLKFVAKPTGKRAESDFSMHAVVRGGLIHRYHFYEDTYAIAHAFRTGGLWTVKNAPPNEAERKVPTP